MFEDPNPFKKKVDNALSVVTDVTLLAIFYQEVVKCFLLQNIASFKSLKTGRTENTININNKIPENI